MAVDSAGNVYVADRDNHAIRKVTPAGVVTTIGRSNELDGPCGVAVDGAGNLYVADTVNQTLRKVTAAGVVTTLAGASRMPGDADGIGADARFVSPFGVVLDGAGDAYVTDRDNHTIRKVTAGGVVTTLAGSPGVPGNADGVGAAARFNLPAAMAIDGAGNVYVADTRNHTIRKVTASGVVTTLAGSAGMPGSTDGVGTAASFNAPLGVAVDSAGNVYVADTNNQAIRKVTATGVVTTLAGAAGMPGTNDGTGTAARFGSPSGVGVDSAGNVYVADGSNVTLRKVTTAGVVTTPAGAAYTRTTADGVGAAARFNTPLGVAVDSTGNVYVTDTSSYTLRKITAAGVATTLAGSAGMGGSADGAGADARFDRPRGVAVDGAGNLYVADTGNDTLRKVTAAGVVTTLAGTAGMPGSTDGVGSDARFHSPSAVAVDGAGNLYVADTGNQTIRKVTAAGVVTTLAGTVGMPDSTDGVGTAARFNLPSGVAVDGAGNVYVADTNNETIRKITAAGAVTTLAGSAGVNGRADGANAKFSDPSGVAVDSAGNVYVADTNNQAIRKVTAAGVVTTTGGTATGILLGANPRFAFPRALAIGGDSLIISDTNAIVVLRHGAQ